MSKVPGLCALIAVASVAIGLPGGAGAAIVPVDAIVERAEARHRIHVPRPSDKPWDAVPAPRPLDSASPGPAHCAEPMDRVARFLDPNPDQTDEPPYFHLRTLSDACFEHSPVMVAEDASGVPDDEPMLCALVFERTGGPGTFDGTDGGDDTNRSGGTDGGGTGAEGVTLLIADMPFGRRLNGGNRTGVRSGRPPVFGPIDASSASGLGLKQGLGGAGRAARPAGAAPGLIGGSGVQPINLGASGSASAGATASAAAVPLPAPLFLLLAAVSGLAAVRRTGRAGR